MNDIYALFRAEGGGNSLLPLMKKKYFAVPFLTQAEWEDSVKSNNNDWVTSTKLPVEIKEMKLKVTGIHGMHQNAIWAFVKEYVPAYYLLGDREEQKREMCVALFLQLSSAFIGVNTTKTKLLRATYKGFMKELEEKQFDTITGVELLEKKPALLEKIQASRRPVRNGRVTPHIPCTLHRVRRTRPS